MFLCDSEAVVANDSPVRGAKQGDGVGGAAELNGSGIWWRKVTAEVGTGQGQTQYLHARFLLLERSTGGSQ